MHQIYSRSQDNSDSMLWLSKLRSVGNSCRILLSRLHCTKTIQTTLNLMSGSTHLGFNDPTEQYRTFKPFSGMNNSNGYNNSVISNISISTIYELYAQNSRLCESSWMMRSILGSYLILHESCPWLTHCICILGDVLSIDHTMRTAAKAVIIDKSHQRIKPFSAVLQVLDEESRILTWVWLSLSILQPN